MCAELSQIYLGHLSRECNCPKLALQVMQKCLQKIGATHVTVEVTSQDVPCSTYELDYVSAPVYAQSTFL